MTKLYELQDQLVQIDEILANNTNEETQEILESARDEIITAIDGKIENILNYIDDCKAKADQLREEIVRLNIKRGSLEKKVDYLKNMLIWYMKSTGEKKASFGNWDITIAKTAGKVVLDACDDAFLTKYKRISWDIDKTLLKQDMVDGKLIVDGKLLAHIEEGDSLRIK